MIALIEIPYEDVFDFGTECLEMKRKHFIDKETYLKYFLKRISDAKQPSVLL